jgi:hypothetical protein
MNSSIEVFFFAGRSDNFLSMHNIFIIMRHSFPTKLSQSMVSQILGCLQTFNPQGRIAYFAELIEGSIKKALLTFVVKPKMEPYTHIVTHPTSPGASYS